MTIPLFFLCYVLILFTMAHFYPVKIASSKEHTTELKIYIHMERHLSSSQLTEEKLNLGNYETNLKILDVKIKTNLQDYRTSFNNLGNLKKQGREREEIQEQGEDQRAKQEEHERNTKMFKNYVNIASRRNKTSWRRKTVKIIHTTKNRKMITVVFKLDTHVRKCIGMKNKFPPNHKHLRPKRQIQMTRTSPFCDFILCNLFHFNPRPMSQPIVHINTGSNQSPSQASNNFWRFFMYPYVRWNPMPTQWTNQNQIWHPPMSLMRPIWGMFLPPSSFGMYNAHGSSGQGIQQGSNVPVFGYGLNAFGNGANGGGNVGTIGGYNNQMGKPAANQDGSRPTNNGLSGSNDRQTGQNTMERPSPQTIIPNYNPTTTSKTSNTFSMSTDNTYTTYVTDINTMRPMQNPSTRTPPEKPSNSMQSTTPSPGLKTSQLTTSKPRATTMRQIMETTTKCNKTKNSTGAKDNIPSTLNIAEDKNLTNQWLNSEIKKIRDKFNKTMTSVVGSNGNGNAGLTGNSGVQRDWIPNHSPPFGDDLFVNKSYTQSNASGYYGNGFQFQENLFTLPNQFNFTQDQINLLVPLWWNITHYEPGFGEGLFVSSSTKPPPETRQYRGQIGNG